jgi:hypothetical protein
MTWTINPTITINGTSYVGSTVGSVSINYGRGSVWETQRAGYAQLQLINLTNTNYGIDINNSVVVKVRNAANTADVTVFTGNITSVGNQVSFSGGSSNITYVNITAVAPLSILSKTQCGAVIYPVETEGNRISRILAETSATIDSVDTGIYTLLSRAINPRDALTLCNAYAGTATGAIYETTDGKVGYASENRRNQDAFANGYFSIPTSNINQRTLTSNSSQGDVINSTKIGYNNGSYVTVTSSGSTAAYGTIAGYLDTEINNETDATLLANIYIGLRAYPQTSLSSVEVRLDDPDISNAVLDKMINTYFGLPIQISSLPLSIYDGTYFGFVEGWNLAFSQISARITLRTTEKTYSYRPTQWEDAPPTQTWNSVGATVQWLDYE